MTPAVIVWVLLLIGVAALWPTLSELARIWQTMFDYRHGYLVAGVAIIWLLKLRRQIDVCPVRPTPIALPALAAAIGMWVVAYRGNSELLQQLLAPLILQLVVLAAMGPQVLLRVAGPLMYLYFAVPIWEHFVPVLQGLTTVVVETLLGFLGVPVVVEGNNVTIPAGRFIIAEGCSGKRYLVIALALATLAGFMQGLRVRPMLWLIGSAVAMALVVNWVRVAVIIYAGHATGMQHYLVANEHETFGYLMFVPLLSGIIYIAHRLGRNEPARRDTAEPGESPAQAVPAGWAWPLALLCVPIGVTATASSIDRLDVPMGKLPILTGAWQGPLPANEDWQPQFTNPAGERRAAYATDANTVEIYVNVYGAQSPGRELVFYKNSVIPSDRWSLIQRLPRRDGTPPMVIAADSTGARWIIAHTYRVGARLTSVPVLAQLYYGAYAVWRPAPAGALAMAAPCLPDCDAAIERVSGFWRDNAEVFATLIPHQL